MVFTGSLFVRTTTRVGLPLAEKKRVCPWHPLIRVLSFWFRMEDVYFRVSERSA